MTPPMTHTETERVEPEITKEDFIKKFVAHMCSIVPFKEFDDGETVEEYATFTAPLYWNDGMFNNDPEEAASGDVDAWNG